MKLIFIGAVGGLKPEFKLGDVCTPAYSLSGSYADEVFFCGENYQDFAAGYGDAGCAFPTQDLLMEALDALLRTHVGEPVCFLIKGSRGMHMERVNDMLETMFGGK